MIDLNFISKISLEYSKAREKNRSVEKLTTLNLLKHCAAEVVEATEAYKDLSYVQDVDIYAEDNKKEFEGELADIIMCVLIIAAYENTDIEEALKDCLEKNRKRAEMD